MKAMIKVRYKGYIVSFSSKHAFIQFLGHSYIKKYVELSHDLPDSKMCLWFFVSQSYRWFKNGLTSTINNFMRIFFVEKKKEFTLVRLTTISRK